MKKKYYIYVYWSAVIGCIMIVCFLIGFFGKKEFNPDLHNCLEFNIDDVRKNPEKYGCYFEPTIVYFREEECNVSIEEYPELCKKWEKKNICQLNPTDEDCVCDEYEKCKETFLNDGTKLCAIEGGYCPYNYWKIHYNKSCIKSHLKNECEKGNEDYIWDYKYEYFQSNYTYNKSKIKYTSGSQMGWLDVEDNQCAKWENKTDVDLVQEGARVRFVDVNITICTAIYEKEYSYEKRLKEKICRKKTIEDLSCPELNNILSTNCFIGCHVLGEVIHSNVLMLEYIEGCIK